MLHKIVDQNGNVYKGEVLRGRRHGRGTIVYADTRDVYQGDFENDVPHGAGRYFRAGAENGLFEGLWKDGELYQVKKGRACIEDSNGDHYDGGFDHWKRHGRGTLKSANGDEYEGYWKQGLRHGEGTLVYSDGTKFEGLFKADEPVVGSKIDDCDDKTVATTASEFETMGLNPYQSKHEPHVEEREITRSSAPNEGRDSDSKKRTPEERRAKAKINTKDHEQQQKQPKKLKKDAKRKIELLEKVKAEGKGQFQRDRRKYLLDAKKDLEKKRWKDSGETGSGRKVGQVEKKYDESEVGKNKNGFFKKFHMERSKDRSKHASSPESSHESSLEEGFDQSTSADGKIDGRVNRQQGVTGNSKQVYSSSRPPAHPQSSNERSSSVSPSRSRPNSRTIPLDSRKRSASLKDEKRSKSRLRGRKKEREKARNKKHDKSQSVSRGRSSSKSGSGESRASRSSSPFAFFRSKSRTPPSRIRASTPNTSSSKASNFSTYSQQSHTLEMLSSSSDSNDPNFFT